MRKTVIELLDTEPDDDDDADDDDDDDTKPRISPVSQVPCSSHSTSSMQESTCPLLHDKPVWSPGPLNLHDRSEAHIRQYAWHWAHEV